MSSSPMLRMHNIVRAARMIFRTWSGNSSRVGDRRLTDHAGCGFEESLCAT